MQRNKAMKIATWNVERLKHKRLLQEMILACNQLKADILILTETDKRIRPSFSYCFQTPNLTEINPRYYRPTENRVSVYTNYKCVAKYPTYDKYSAICVELETELGNLLVYGTIIGIEGNRMPSFREDLYKQVKDFDRLTADGKPLCIIGDYNISFADNYYFTNYGRDTIRRCFSENHIMLLTENTRECIDHIAMSNEFILNTEAIIDEWNLDRKMSDHKGVVATILPR